MTIAAGIMRKNQRREKVKIMFVSPQEGIGTTYCMMAVAAAAARNLKKSCLLMQIPSAGKELEKLISEKKRESDSDPLYQDMGIDTLVRYFKSKRLSGIDVDNCSICLGGKLYLLPGTGGKAEDGLNEADQISIMLRIINAAEEYFELVMVDIGVERSETAMRIMNMSDAVCVVGNQGRTGFKKMYAFAACEKIAEEKIFYCFGKYLPESTYNLKNMQHIFEGVSAANSGVVPISAAYLDAVEDHRTIRFLSGFEGDPEETSDPVFFRDAVNCAKKLAKSNKRRRI